MLPWQPGFQSNQPIYNLIQPSPYLMMLYMKFDKNWLTDLRDNFFENVNSLQQTIGIYTNCMYSGNP